MRQTCEIIADLKDGKEVPYEELRAACLAQSSIIYFFQRDTKALLKGGISADLTRRMEYSDRETSSEELGIPSWYWKAMKKDPVEWLGPFNIPGTEQWKAKHELHERVLKTIMEKNII